MQGGGGNGAGAGNARSSTDFPSGLAASCAGPFSKAGAAPFDSGLGEECRGGPAFLPAAPCERCASTTHSGGQRSMRGVSRVHATYSADVLLSRCCRSALLVSSCERSVAGCRSLSCPVHYPEPEPRLVGYILLEQKIRVLVCVGFDERLPAQSGCSPPRCGCLVPVVRRRCFERCENVHWLGPLQLLP